MSSKPFIDTGGSAKIDPAVEEETEEDLVKDSWSNKWEVTRIKIKKFLASHFLGLLYAQILLYLSIFSAFQYVYSTYTPANSTSTTTYLLNVIEMMLAALLDSIGVYLSYSRIIKLNFLQGMCG